MFTFAKRNSALEFLIAIYCPLEVIVAQTLDTPDPAFIQGCCIPFYPIETLILFKSNLQLILKFIASEIDKKADPPHLSDIVRRICFLN
jgi:hypothetical protein